MATGKVFKQNNDQLVQLPIEADFPDDVKKVAVRVVGKDRILSPISNNWDSFFLQGAAVTDDFMTKQASQQYHSYASGMLTSGKDLSWIAK